MAIIGRAPRRSVRRGRGDESYHHEGQGLSPPAALGLEGQVQARPEAPAEDAQGAGVLARDEGLFLEAGSQFYKEELQLYIELFHNS